MLHINFSPQENIYCHFKSLSYDMSWPRVRIKIKECLISCLKIMCWSHNSFFNEFPLAFIYFIVMTSIELSFHWWLRLNSYKFFVKRLFSQFLYILSDLKKKMTSTYLSYYIRRYFSTSSRKTRAKYVFSYL